MYDKTNGYIWINGNAVKWKDANIHIMTHSLHYASSVFEGIRAYGGKILKAYEHYNRLYESAEYLNHNISYTIEKLINITNKLMTKNNLENCYIRVLVWYGSKKMTVSYNGGDTNIAIVMWKRIIDYSNDNYIHGIHVNVSDWRRPDPKTTPAHIKASGLYMISAISKYKSEKLGFNDSIMLDYEDNIAEATSANIFFIENRIIYTPPVKCFLNGITRRICIEIAKENGIKVIEKNFTLNDLLKVEEIFLTGTAIEILPINTITINKNNILKFKPGKITKIIQEKFRNLTMMIN